MFDTPQTDVRIIGHRGAAAVAPENTLASFRAAAALGVRWVEMDVSLLGDGTPVIFHDEQLDRCTDGRGKLTEVGMPYVAQLDAGLWFAAEFAGERIPTLSVALQEIQRLGLGLNLEIKHEGPGLEQLVEVVLATLAQEWRDNDQLLLSSFNHQALRLCQLQAPHLRRGQLYETVPSTWPQELADIAAYSLHCDYLALDVALARGIKAAGYRLLCYTVNHPQAVALHWGWGMDAIFTDDPAQFMGSE
jgi:glycerophosphoryl diester phosphodiesterase